MPDFAKGIASHQTHLHQSFLHVYVPQRPASTKLRSHKRQIPNVRWPTVSGSTAHRKQPAAHQQQPFRSPCRHSNPPSTGRCAATEIHVIGTVSSLPFQDEISLRSHFPIVRTRAARAVPFARQRRRKAKGKYGDQRHGHLVVQTVLQHSFVHSLYYTSHEGSVFAAPPSASPSNLAVPGSCSTVDLQISAQPCRQRTAANIDYEKFVEVDQVANMHRVTSLSLAWLLQASRLLPANSSCGVLRGSNRNKI